MNDFPTEKEFYIDIGIHIPYPFVEVRECDICGHETPWFKKKDGDASFYMCTECKRIEFFLAMGLSCACCKQRAKENSQGVYIHAVDVENAPGIRNGKHVFCSEKCLNLWMALAARVDPNDYRSLSPDEAIAMALEFIRLAGYPKGA